MPRDHYLIAQISDVHFGDRRHDPALVSGCLERLREAAPDIVLVAGDLTAEGYPEEYEQVLRFFDQLPAPWLAVPGNHDERNVGWRIYEREIGERWHIQEVPFDVPSSARNCTRMRIVSCDSAEPDLDDGELGRVRHRWITEGFDDAQDEFRVVMLHHHLVAVPNTGRERNTLSDAGDVLEVLGNAGIDLVLAGHKHVPYVWVVNRLPVVMSGTATTWRIRGEVPPSFNLISIDPENITITMVFTSGEQPRAFRLPRRP